MDLPRRKRRGIPLIKWQSFIEWLIELYNLVLLKNLLADIRVINETNQCLNTSLPYPGK